MHTNKVPKPNDNREMSETSQAQISLSFVTSIFFDKNRFHILYGLDYFLSLLTVVLYVVVDYTRDQSQKAGLPKKNSKPTKLAQPASLKINLAWVHKPTLASLK